MDQSRNLNWLFFGNIVVGPLHESEFQVRAQILSALERCRGYEHTVYTANQ